jgi:hypothetical protein
VSQISIVVTLKKGASVAAVQTGLRNAGFDQKLATDTSFYGTIDEDQYRNLAVITGIDSVKPM